MALDRRLILATLALAALTACGKKGEPEPPGGGKTPARSHPNPEPVPWQAPQQQKK